MTEQLYWRLLAGLAVWRVTHLLSREDGPWNCFGRLRDVVAKTFSATLVSCFYCLSLWIAAPLAWWLGTNWKEQGLLWLALSASAIFLERMTGRDASMWSVPYFEHEESGSKGASDVLLRKK